ncbi:unnamed protein product [Paramecium sonneborni]|uniref:Protein kinase domain-containing protein n=1 Tax=Paramecium sonneborni TaxID=65129 RepID=A0A8S1MHE0_9CILI|nr:unnamed protein product [Paramecium sonneborni]
MDFYSLYQIYDQIQGPQYGINNNIFGVIPNFTLEEQINPLVALMIPKNQVQNTTLTKYRTLKYLNILQPYQYCCSQNEHFLIYLNLFQYQLNDEKLSRIINTEGYRILLQLALTFAEFEKRNFNWPLYSINQVYYMEGIVYLSLLEYNFSQIDKPYNSLAIFWNFINQYFLYKYQDLIQFQNQKDLQNVTRYLFQKNDNVQIQSGFDPDFQKLLSYLLRIDNYKQIYNGNSIVKSFKKPKAFSLNFPTIKNEIVYKQTKIYGDEEERQQILKQIDRDIQLMELFNNSENVATCFTYLRVFDFVFLLYQKFAGTLVNGFNNWQKQQQTVEQFRKDVYRMAAKTAKSLLCLHDKDIIHRDLKPENIFIDYEQISSSQFYIADFDCSKQIKEGINVEQTREYFTPKYDPPEIIQTLKYDIFQIGLIILTVANKGIYIGDVRHGPRGLSEYDFEKFYNRKAIENSLSQIGYDQKFLDILSQCLLRDPNQRPNIRTLYECLNSIYLRQNIRIIKSTPRIIQQQTQDFYYDRVIIRDRSNSQQNPQQTNQFQNGPNQIPNYQPQGIQQMQQNNQQIQYQNQQIFFNQQNYYHQQ